VSDLLQEFDRARRVLDPFAGTGTTPLVVTHAGLDAGWVEVNPLMRLVIEAKLQAAPALAGRGRHGVIQAFERASLVHGAIALGTDVGDLHFMHTKRAFFEERILRDLRAAISWIDTIDYDPPLRDLLRLAVAAITVSCSNMKRAADLRYRRGREVEEVESNVGAALDLQLARMKDDILALGTDGPSFLGRAVKVGEDARSLPGEGNFDLVVTSPPYLNGTNYFRNTKLELLVLGLIQSEEELTSLHTRALTAGINNVSSRIEEPRVFPAVEKVARKLDRCAYDPRIPVLVRAYASDMALVLEGIERSLVAGGTLLLDIGDSCFCGVRVPTDEILVELARGAGLRHRKTVLLRKRWSNRGAPLRQVLLRFDKVRARGAPPTGGAGVPPAHGRAGETPTPPVVAGARRFMAELPHTKPPYAARNWGNPLHSLCSYQGKLKPSLAHHLVARFTRPGDTVLDPLGGVGTIAFEAALQGRHAISNDVNPIAQACATAKLGVPERAAVEECLARLARSLDSEERLEKRELPSFNGPLENYYHPRTLEEILRARAFFGESPATTPSEALVLASLLHVLHGNRPYALSRRSHGLTPFAPTGPFERKPLLEHLRAKVERSLEAAKGESFIPGRSVGGDFRDLPARLEAGSVDAVICSPPFVNSTRFYLANWIRLWFCGWEVEDFDESRAPRRFLEVEQRRSRVVYESYFETCARLARPGALMVLHLGASARCDMGEELAGLSGEHWSVAGVFREDVRSCEKHGLSDQGATLWHELLFATRK
jgi:tRNA G10  N-methylase Trm11